MRVSIETAAGWIARESSLVESFATVFPSHPSLADVRLELRAAAGNLQKLASGRNPFSKSNPEPANEAAMQAWPRIHIMMASASATNDEQVKIVRATKPQGQGDFLSTLEYYERLMAAVVASRRNAPTVSAGTPPAPAPATPVVAATSSVAAAPATAAATATRADTGTILARVGPGGTSYVSSLSAGGDAGASPADTTTVTTSSTPANPGAATPARAGVLPLLLGVAAVVGLVAFAGRRGR